MSTPDRNRLAQRPSNSAPAKLRAIPSTGDAATDRAIDAIREHLEVREGSRGNPWEKAVTLRDLHSELQDMGLIAGTAQAMTPRAVSMGTATGTVMLQKPGGGFLSVPIEVFADSIRQTQLYKDLSRRIDDPTRFDELPAKVKALLLPDLNQIAAERGADIRNLQLKVQSAEESLAATVTEVTAAVHEATAGIRQSLYAVANQSQASAGGVTSISARLDSVGGGASVEVQMSALASRATGLEAKYTVKVSAGGVTTGFGLASTSNTAGASSAFLIQADQFAIVPSSYAGGLTTTPPAGSVPFGVDAITGNVFMSGSLLVGGRITAASYTTSTGSSTAARVEITAWNSGADANCVIGYSSSNVEMMRLNGGIGKLFLNCSSILEAAASITNNATLPTVIARNNGSGSAVKGVAGGAGYGLESTGPAYVSGNLTVGGSVIGNLSGTSSNSEKLNFGGTGAGLMYAANGGGTPNSYSALMQTDGNFVVYHGGTPYWDAATDLSDARMKDDIVETAQGGLDTVNALRVVDFKWSADSPFDDTTSTQTGFIAQEVLEVVPKAVKEISGTLLLHKEELVPFLVKAVQELCAQVQELQARVTTLENP